MPHTAGYAPLDRSLATLAELGAVPATGPVLARHVDAVRARLGEVMLAEIPAFTQSRNPDVLPELMAHSDEHVHEIVRLLGGGAPGALGFVVEQARRRAEQRFPVEASLHAYRCGHKVIYNWIREHAVANPGADNRQVESALADFSIDYVDRISTVFAAEYVAQTRLIAEAEGDRRMELMTILLGGYDEGDGRVARLLRRAGYLEQRQAYCIAIAQSADAREMENPARARRLADALSQCLGALSGRRLVGLHDDQAIAIVSDTRRVSGWTAPRTDLADRVYPALLKLGPAAVVGMSSDVPSTAHIPRALNEARVALDFATVGKRVVRYGEIPVREMLLRQVPGELQAALPAWVDALLTADANSGGSLLATLRAYAATDMNVLRAARSLNVHANTVYTRLARIEDMTGLDARGYTALTELLLAADLRQG